MWGAEDLKLFNNSGILNEGEYYVIGTVYAIGLGCLKSLT